MLKKSAYLIWVLSLFVLAGSLEAGDSYILIKNARIIPMEGKNFTRGSILIKNDKIARIQDQIREQKHMQIIDAKGKFVYPGLIAPLTIVGLVTRPGIPNDVNEKGSFNPHMQAADAINPEDNCIDVTRIDGITTVLTVPGSRSIVNGKAVILNLWGTITDHLIMKEYAAQVFNMGAKNRNRYPSTLPGVNMFLREKLREVKKYLQKKKSGDFKMEALVPVLKGKIPVIFITSNEVTLRLALKIIADYNLKGIIYATSGILKYADIIAGRKIGVIWGGTMTMPRRWEPIDQNYRTAGILAKKGILFCFNPGGWGLPSTNARTLPVPASISVAYGLSEEDALKALTINTARILGIDQKVGSLKTGKLANLVICSKPIVQASAKIDTVIIKGNFVPMTSFQTRLRDKFQKIIRDRQKKRAN